MIRLSVMYPAAPGSRFDWGYYRGQHVELSRRLLSPRWQLRRRSSLRNYFDGVSVVQISEVLE